MRLALYIVSLSILMISCKDEVIPTPKPRMYPRVAFPEHSYKPYASDACKLEFEYPTYANISKSEYKYGDESQSDCWFNIEIPKLNAAIYCDYTEVTPKDNIDKLVQDAFKIVSKHNIKANYREENVIENQNGAQGILFDIKGPVATPYQFYLTDGKDHFFRASLYFNSKVNPDSMQIIHNFVREDIDHMIRTFQWK